MAKTLDELQKEKENVLQSKIQVSEKTSLQNEDSIDKGSVTNINTITSDGNIYIENPNAFSPSSAKRLSPKEELIQEIISEYVKSGKVIGLEHLYHVLILPNACFNVATGEVKDRGYIQTFGKKEFMIISKASMPGKELFIINDPND